MLWIWIGFIAFVLVMLALDLGVFNRKAHTVSAKEAMRWVGVFVSLALMFNVAVYFMYRHDWMGLGTRFAASMTADDLAAARAPQSRPDGHPPESAPSLPSAAAPATGTDGFRPASRATSGHRLGLDAAMQFFAGWLTEYSLSIDNIFVIALVFSFFKVPPKYQHRVLFWGILGALVFRGVMIGIGAQIIANFEWVLLAFGAFLVYQGIGLIKPKDEDFNPADSIVVRLARRLFPISPAMEGEKFFTRIDGRRAITPLFLVLLVVEVTDVVFAVDSIPAIFGITRDPFIVFTSNVFAIMGLRSLYFALASLLDKFHFLHYSLSAILIFVGTKMLIENAHWVRKLGDNLPESVQPLTSWLPAKVVHLPTAVSLGTIIGVLAAGVVASLIWSKNHPKPDA